MKSPVVVCLVALAASVNGFNVGAPIAARAVAAAPASVTPTMFSGKKSSAPKDGVKTLKNKQKNTAKGGKFSGWISEENWLVELVTTLTELPKSQGQKGNYK